MYLNRVFFLLATINFILQTLNAQSTYIRVLIFSTLKRLNRSSLSFIIFIVGSFCISAQTSTQFDTKLNIRSLSTEMDVAYDRYAYETPTDNGLSQLNLRTHELVLRINLGEGDQTDKDGPAKTE